uniref:Uncharacterized protein n=1 Tax=Rhizophora mucronata TaxID=61149 RepID=A0A2P2JJK7_RHIMU
MKCVRYLYTGPHSFIAVIQRCRPVSKQRIVLRVCVCE